MNLRRSLNFEDAYVEPSVRMLVDDIPYSDQFVMMLVREAPKITYTEYFEILTLLDNKRKQIKKEKFKQKHEFDFNTFNLFNSDLTNFLT